MRHIVNFQTDLLRTFVSVIDLGAFTKAGEALGWTQPAIPRRSGGWKSWWARRSSSRWAARSC